MARAAAVAAASVGFGVGVAVGRRWDAPAATTAGQAQSRKHLRPKTGVGVFVLSRHHDGCILLGPPTHAASHRSSRTHPSACIHPRVPAPRPDSHRRSFVEGGAGAGARQLAKAVSSACRW